MHSCPLGPTELFGEGLRYVLRPGPRARTECVEEAWPGVRSLAESLMHRQQMDPRPYTLGTVALAPRTIPGEREVVNGGQFLATLRLLLAVVRDLAADQGLEAQARTLDPLVGDDGSLDPCFDGHEGAGPTTVGEPSPTHTALTEQITHWLQGPELAERSDALVRTVRDHLRVTVVDLEPGRRVSTDEAREGPAADRVRDLLFTVAEEQGADTVWLYRTCWAPFDHGHWRKVEEEHPRVDEFLGVWLTMCLGETVRPERMLMEFDALVRRE